MSTTTAVASTTSTGSADVSVASGSAIQVWTSPRLRAGETVLIYRIDTGDTVEEAVVQKNKQLAITKENSSVLLNGPANFRIRKDVTAVATAVYYDS